MELHVAFGHWSCMCCRRVFGGSWKQCGYCPHGGPHNAYALAYIASLDLFA